MAARTLIPVDVQVRAYWFACARGDVPEQNPLDELDDAQRAHLLRAMRGGVAYDVYRRSLAWRAFRDYMLRVVCGECEHCGMSELESMLLVLDVHHLHYRTLGRERPEDVLVLCRRCHEEADRERLGLAR